jgi:hypothetical protein
MNAYSLLLGLLCGAAIGYAFGWQERRRKLKLVGSQVRDCDGPSPCTTCPDKRQCGRTGCIRPMPGKAAVTALQRIRAGIAADRCDGESEYASGVNAACRNHLEFVDRVIASEVK